MNTKTNFISLQEFTAEVNAIEHARCAEINKKPGLLFRAAHNDLPESMMELYYNQGYAPQECVDIMRLELELELEGYAEAAAS